MNMSHYNQDFYNRINDISTQTMKTVSLLRLLKYRLVGSLEDAISTDDLMVAIDLCLDTIPHESDDISNPLEEIIHAYSVAIDNANKLREETQSATETVYSAMNAIANPDTPIEVLTEAGMELYRLAQCNIELEQKWDVWMEIVKLRGFAVGWVIFSDNDRRLHLTAAGLPDFMEMPEPNRAGRLIAERLSAEKIENLAMAFSSGVAAYIKSALASTPEPLKHEA